MGQQVWDFTKSAFLTGSWMVLMLGPRPTLYEQTGFGAGALKLVSASEPARELAKVQVLDPIPSF